VLPDVTDIESFRRLRRDVLAQRPAFEALARRHGLDVGALEPFAQGTHLVWSARTAVIKVFIPLWPQDAEVETAMLAHLTGTGLPVPQLEAAGALGAFPYVVMSRLPGQPTGDVWPSLDARTRVDLATEIGEHVAALGALAPPGLPVQTVPQEALLAERLARVLADQRDRGADERLVAEIGAFVDALGELPPAEDVLLHADLTGDHFLVEEGRVTGLIDFADAFVGPWTYELAAPACFTVFGDPEAQRALLAGMGRRPTPELGRAVRAWAVLHRYGHVARMAARRGHATLAPWLDAVWSA
jgi:hygromycin-B 7''-O-kinase